MQKVGKHSLGTIRPHDGDRGDTSFRLTTDGRCWKEKEQKREREREREREPSAASGTHGNIHNVRNK